MKKHFTRLVALILVLCMALAVPAMAATPISLTVSIEDDEGNPYIYKFSRTTRYLTENTNLLYEVVKIINDMYSPVDRTTDLWKFDSKAMKMVMDAGLEAYSTGSNGIWQNYVDEYYTEVQPVAGDRTLKSILRDKTSVVGDLWPNVEHKISFTNTVQGDKKYGVTYTVTVIRNGGSTPDYPVRPGRPGDVFLNMDDHFAYIKGYPDGTVRPNSYITREEVTTIFYRLLLEESLAVYQTADCDFTDVEFERWSRVAIATMANAGIVNGYPDDSFRPQNNMTRAEFAAVAARFDEVYYNGQDMFSDIAGHWAADEINCAASKGWIKGYNGMFRPDDYITRAEAVTLINRVLERAPETPQDLLYGMKTFSDNMDTSKWFYLDIQEAANGHDYVRKYDGYHESWVGLYDQKIPG